MSKARNLSNFVSDGGPFADGLLEVSDISDITATAAEVNLLDGATVTTAELNVLDGATVTTAELNILDGVTATATELNFVDGVTSAIQTQLNAKVAKTGDTGAALIPVGTEAQRPTPAAGQLRFNSDASTFEGYDGTEWGSVGGGGGAILEAVASGTLPNGSPVVINRDGTVSAVTGSNQELGSGVVFEGASADEISTTFDSNLNKVVIAYRDVGNSNFGTAIVGTVSGTSISFGTPVVFESAHALAISTTFDSNLNKVVIAYRDVGNSNFGTAIVGTVSGTSISFGTPVVFESALTSVISTTFDSNLNKVVIAYTDGGNSNFGTATVGTVSGTSISFGTPVVFESANTTQISTTFDSNLNKVVIAYSDVGNSNFGTAIVGTVSGTSISFGTPVVFESANTTQISTTFDSNLNKVVIAYRDVGNSNFGTAIVGTVSGTSISFGTPVVFESATTTQISATFDSNLNKVVIAYSDVGNSNFGTAIVGTVSGTSISFGTPVVFESASTFDTSTTFDSNLNKVVIAYRDVGNSDFGTAVVFKPVETNLGVFNFIGISSGSYTDTQTATVQLISAVNEAQSGLTTAARYFVQTDGTLSTTADTPEVYAGLAVSATKIIVKG